MHALVFAWIDLLGTAYQSEPGRSTIMSYVTGYDWFLILFLFGIAPVAVVAILNICLKDVPADKRTVSPGATLFSLIPGVWVLEMFLAGWKRIPESLGEHANSVEKAAHQQIRAQRGGQAPPAGGEEAPPEQNLPTLDVGDCNKAVGLFWALAGVPNLVSVLCYLVVALTGDPQYLFPAKVVGTIGFLLFVVMAIIYVVRFKDTVSKIAHWHPY